VRDPRDRLRLVWAAFLGGFITVTVTVTVAAASTPHRTEHTLTQRHLAPAALSRCVLCSSCPRVTLVCCCRGVLLPWSAAAMVLSSHGVLLPWCSRVRRQTALALHTHIHSVPAGAAWAVQHGTALHASLTSSLVMGLSHAHAPHRPRTAPPTHRTAHAPHRPRTADTLPTHRRHTAHTHCPRGDGSSTLAAPRRQARGGVRALRRGGGRWRGESSGLQAWRSGVALRRGAQAWRREVARGE
jgi:hypothetical protein